MAVRVVAVSDSKRDPLLEVARDWLARSDRRFAPELVLVKPKRRSKDDATARRDEAAALLAASAGCTRVALDAGGKEHGSSDELAAALERLLAQGRDVAFLIGGASGHDQAVRDVADHTWSLSRLTFPHRLAVLVMCEQIYRAGEIARGGPYAR